jgi:hypothetical protein
MPISAESLKAKIDAFREEIGRNITFYVSSLEPCTLCLPSGYYDATNDTTTYFTCPVCDGQYYLPTKTETEVLARVHWVSDQAVTATPGGKYYVGDCNVHIDPTYRTLAESAQSNTGGVIVDGHDMQIQKIIPQGAPSINRTRVILTNKGSRPS